MDSIIGLSGLTGLSSSLGTPSGTGTAIGSATGATPTISDKQVFDASLVTSTLNTLNAGNSGGNSLYDFQNTILSGKAASIGLNFKA